MKKYHEISIYIRIDVSEDGIIYGWHYDDDCSRTDTLPFVECDICTNRELCARIEKALDKMVINFNKEAKE